jgi:hypothetical protein
VTLSFDVNFYTKAAMKPAYVVLKQLDTGGGGATGGRAGIHRERIQRPK